jgi:serine/threonine protein kinase
MPAPSSVEELLDLVRKSGVVEEKRLSSHLSRVRESGAAQTDVFEFATQMVRDGVLTKFQAEQFLQGKWRRFTLGKYRVLEKLGSGGMGSVYLCEHTLMRRRVAVKVLPPQKSNDSSSLDRFRREARAVAALDHPNIVRAYDMDQDGDLHFLVMEHVDGASLQEIVKANPAGIDSLRACHYVRQAALGLQHAHEAAGLIHRDIKPGNILVDRNGIVKVLDMGLARFFHDEEDQLTKKFDENVLGTADYLAPEQALDSHTVDIRADIYSLGATFYYVLTGRTPFSEGSVAQKLIWHQTRAPRPVRSIRPDVPESVVAIVEKMMAKSPDDRFQTPQSVADALEPLTRTAIPPPPDSEMPQLSLAATRTLNPGGDAAQRGEVGSKSRRSWSVSGTATHTPSPAPVQDTAGPATPPPVVVAPPPRTAAAPPPPPAPPSPAPSPSQASPRPRPSVPTMELPPAPRNTPAPAPVPTVTASAPAPPELTPVGPAEPMAATVASPDVEADFVPEPLSRTRRRPPEPASGKALWIGAGIGGALLLVTAGVAAYLLLFTNPTPRKPPPPPRGPLRVTQAVMGGLGQVLRQQAREGDRILLEVDIAEADLVIDEKLKNLTIEAAPGKKVTWKAPAKADPLAKLLRIGGATGLTLKGITLDAADAVEGAVLVFGLCEGLRLEDVEVVSGKKYGILFGSAAGSAEKPITLNNVRVRTTRPDQSAVRFQTFASITTIGTNDHIQMKQLHFEGPGRKLTRATAEAVGKSVELPPGHHVDLVP